MIIVIFVLNIINFKFIIVFILLINVFLEIWIIFKNEMFVMIGGVIKKKKEVIFIYIFIMFIV